MNRVREPIVRCGGVMRPIVIVICVVAIPAIRLSAEDRRPAARVVRVTPPEATGAVEVSVAINPTNPDHMVAVSIARMKDHPGITDFAYVTSDAGQTWKMVPRANPHKVQQGDDVVTFTPDGLAIHAFI